MVASAAAGAGEAALQGGRGGAQAGSCSGGVQRAFDQAGEAWAEWLRVGNRSVHQNSGKSMVESSWNRH